MVNLIRICLGQHRHRRIFAIIAVLVLQCVSAYRLDSLNSLEEDSSNEAAADASASLKSLQSKLDSILDTESHEKKLLESLLFENERNESPSPKVQLQNDETPKPASSSMDAIVQNLFDNSRRMESMIGMLTDFKTFLSQTIATQEKQLAYKTEVIELREEVGYLKQEIDKVKSQQAAAAQSTQREPGSSAASANRLRNDETTIAWLKDSVLELRHEIVEVSSSLNVTGLLHLQQQLRLQEKSVHRDVQGLQRQAESLQLGSEQNSEQLLEIQGDLADVRAWQAKMGLKLVRTTTHQRENIVQDAAMRLKALQENLGTEEVSKKHNSKNDRDRTRHSSKKQLQRELHKVERLVLELVKDQNVLARKVEELETGSGKDADPNHERAVWKKVVQRANDNDGNGNDDGLLTITYSEDNNINDENEDFESTKVNSRRRRIRREGVYEHGPFAAAILSRVSALEKLASEHANGLDLMDNKVSGLAELHTTTKSLFASLETIESKYDVKIGDLQSTMAKVEAGMSAVRVATDELKEQQNTQEQSVRACKKETRALGQMMHSTQLRVASLQNQILNWGMKLCHASTLGSIESLKTAKIAAAAFDNEI